MNGWTKFLAISCAAVIAAVVGLDCQAKCRCNGGGRGERKAARKEQRQERRACKRRLSAPVCTPDGGGGSNTYYNPYGGDEINQTWGARASRVGCVEVDELGDQYTVTLEWANRFGQPWEKHCYGTYCVDVRAPQSSQPKKPTPAKSQSDVAPAPSDPSSKEEATKAAEQPAVEPPEETPDVKPSTEPEPVGSLFPPGVLPGT